MTALDDELAIEEAEARLGPLLDAHGRAVIAALRAGGVRPPWPAALRQPAVARLVARHDRGWTARARTLARWSLAARLDADPAVAAARTAPATADGLAARHRALGEAARRLGHPDAAALVQALFGARPARPAIADADDGPAPALPALPLPGWREVRAALAGHAGVDPARVVVLDDGRAAATVVTSTGVTCVVPPVDDLAGLTVAAHELGHGVYAAAMAGLPLGLAAAPTRVVDEAVAAWAVRQLEALLPPAWAAVAAWRRRRGERARARLAAVEHRALVGGAPDDAWAVELGPWRPALAEAVLAEPGVAAAYAAADALALAPGPGQIAAWGATGAALSTAGLA